jgi:hypothetical protein
MKEHVDKVIGELEQMAARYSGMAQELKRIFGWEHTTSISAQGLAALAPAVAGNGSKTKSRSKKNALDPRMEAAIRVANALAWPLDADRLAPALKIERKHAYQQLTRWQMKGWAKTQRGTGIFERTAKWPEVGAARPGEVLLNEIHQEIDKGKTTQD